MIKLAILGSENSHCSNFASALAPLEGEKLFDDVELIGVFGEPGAPGVSEGNDRVKKASSCSVFAEDKDAFLDCADAIMVTARDGANHLKYAENYIKKGIPVWIDKPTTRSVKEVQELVQLADKHGCVLSGGSSLEHCAQVKKYAEFVKENKDGVIGAHFTAPVEMVNPYGNFWFYSQHLVAMITTVFGFDIKSVNAVKTKHGVQVLYHYDNITVSGFFGTGYSITMYHSNHSSESVAFPLESDYYVSELKTFYDVIKTGKPDKTRKAYIAPVYILDATIRSFENNEEVAIDIPLD